MKTVGSFSVIVQASASHRDMFVMVLMSVETGLMKSVAVSDVSVIVLENIGQTPSFMDASVTGKVFVSPSQVRILPEKVERQTPLHLSEY